MKRAGLSRTTKLTEVAGELDLGAYRPDGGLVRQVHLVVLDDGLHSGHVAQVLPLDDAYDGEERGAQDMQQGGPVGGQDGAGLRDGAAAAARLWPSPHQRVAALQRRLDVRQGPRRGVHHSDEHKTNFRNAIS